MYKTIVFDFDGTLVDSNSIKHGGFYCAIEEDVGGAELMTSVLKRVKGNRRDVFDAYLTERRCNTTVISSDVENLVNKYNMIVDNAIISAPEMPGATLLIDRLLFSGCKLILSSATPHSNLAWILEKRGWQHYFESVHGAPANKTNTLEQILLTQTDGVSTLAVVGDGDDDRQSAAAVGCRFFPVGEARGVSMLERKYSLFDLQNELLQLAEF